MLHEPGELGPRESFSERGFAGLRPGEQEVRAQGVIEDVGVLGDDAHPGAEILLGVPANVAAAEPYLAALGVPEPQGEVHQRALPRAAGPDDRDPPAGPQSEGDVFEDQRAILLVAEAHPVELEGIIRGRRKGLRWILDPGLRVHDLEEPFSGANGAAEELEGGPEGCYGLEAAQGYERQKGQVDAVYLPRRDERHRRNQYRNQRQVHQQVAQ